MLGIAKPIDDDSKEFTIKTLTDIFEAQARINKKKRNLQRRDDQTAADWLELADEYKQIDSRANVAFCTSKAMAFGATASQAGFEVETSENIEEWWNK